MVASVAGCALGIMALSLIVARDLHGSLPLLGDPSASPDWASLQRWGSNLAVVQLTLLALAVVLVIAWTHRVYRNLEALEVVGTRLHRRWALFGWLIPGVNLIVPKRILDDTWRASDPDMLPWSTDWCSASVPTTNSLWLVTSLVALPVVVLAQIQLSLVGTLPPDSATSHQSVGILYLALAMAEALLVFAAVVLLKVINSISERQNERVRMIGPPPTFRLVPNREADEAESTDAPAPVLSEPPVEPVLVRSFGSTPIGRY